MGPFAYVRPRLHAVLREMHATGKVDQFRVVRYVGRPAAASPATASASIHKEETARVVAEALAE